MAMEKNVCVVVGNARIRPASTEMTPDEAKAEAKRCTAASPCLYCDVCQLMCPDLAITRDTTTSVIQIDLNYCKGCALCAHYCPHGAISMVVDE
jgi:2-oxoacid:acceptor oxidoreductase delta subunit (pyruvate/2-ketoisovalerate family)